MKRPQKNPKNGDEKMFLTYDIAPE